jgi:hypothetical protein
MNHYIFIDESGDLGFSETSSKFWIAGAMVVTKPSYFYHDLADLKYDLMATQDFREKHSMFYTSTQDRTSTCKLSTIARGRS